MRSGPFVALTERSVGPASRPECLSECKSVTASHPEYLAERSEPYSELFGVPSRAFSVGYSGLCVCISPIVRGVIFMSRLPIVAENHYLCRK